MILTDVMQEFFFWFTPFGKLYFFNNETELGAEIKPGMTLTSFPSSFLDEMIFKPTTFLIMS
jgi:hypothetical protein